jgi:uncharacterized protein
MQVPNDAILLRMFFGEEDRFKGKPLYEAIVQKAREMHLAGATVLRNENCDRPHPIGGNSKLHRAVE